MATLSNAQIAAAFHRISQLLELTGADSFRASAHARAARTIEDSRVEFAALATQENGRNRLLEVEGIGPKIADKIIELVTKGRIGELDELAAAVPKGLLELLTIPGCGPKTVRMWWTDAGVKDLAGLKKIIDNGSILKLPRMGAKSVEKLKQSIAMLAESGKRLHIGPARLIADGVIEQLRTVKGVKQIEAAGSLRRGKETIGDIDILVATTDDAAAANVSEKFRTLPQVKQVITAGDTRASVRIAIASDHDWGPGEEDGDADAGTSVQVDLKVVPPASWGAALMYFTGSKEHNVKLRSRALDMGMTLNEYGLFPDDPKAKHDEPPHKRGVKPVASKTEQEIYKALKTPWVPPEAREDRGELELKATPRFVEVADIRAELHSHTTASDGSMTIKELAEAAQARGFHTIAVTDHSQSSAIANGLKPKRLREHIAAVRATKVKDIAILTGSEVDILADGRLDYDDDLLAELDVVVASPHAALSQEPDAATERLLKAIRHPLVHILGHPTGRLIARRQGLSPDMAKLIAAAKEHDVALEINAHWMRLDLRDSHVRAAVEAGCLIAIDCDVHQPGDFDNLRFGVQTGRRGWLPPEQCINTWDARKLHGWLKRKRK